MASLYAFGKVSLWPSIRKNGRTRVRVRERERESYRERDREGEGERVTKVAEKCLFKKETKNEEGYCVQGI